MYPFRKRIYVKSQIIFNFSQHQNLILLI